ncbi:MAG: isoprenylcysteine carboxylmethyltransferase family protein [Candidatus Sumerlaeia bacterium]|nr:isoprenylcysteine carboxylmethyltransferase family protein [Candidatus Sumerlaeia bacterium]
MNTAEIFKIILIIEYIIFSIILLLYLLQSRKNTNRTIFQETKDYSVAVTALIGYEVITLGFFLWLPQILLWASLALPFSFRLGGAVLGMLALVWFIVIYKHLGNNYSTRLAIKERHTLVTSGPYRLIRHPMYSALFLLHLATFLLTANLLIGITWLIGLSVVIYLRSKKEEEIMIRVFGQEYLEYMKRTGRFIPRVNKLLINKGLLIPVKKNS